MTTKTKQNKPTAAELRDNLLGTANEPRSEIVKLKQSNGRYAQYEVREPSVGVRNTIRRQSTPPGTSYPDLEQFDIRMLVKQTFIPGTDTRVFEDGDYDVIMKGTDQKWIMKLRNAVVRCVYDFDAQEDDDAKKG